MNKRKDYLAWDEYFMAIAKLSAMRSKDPSTQVGACIVSNDNRILSIGYNGAPNGFDDEKFPWGREGNNLDTKYPYVCHAEMNAILNYRGNKKDLEVVEPKSNQHYFLIEDEFGTSFIYLKRFNGCKYLDDFKKIGINYGIIYQDDLERKELINLVELLNQGKIKEIDELLGRNRGFLNRKTIYQVKKDGKN